MRDILSLVARLGIESYATGAIELDSFESECYQD